MRQLNKENVNNSIRVFDFEKMQYGVTVIKIAKILAVIFLIAIFQSSMAQTPELNFRVVDYALKNLDQKVGKGVCRELVYKALEASNAIMGDTICFDEVKPGDIYLPATKIAILNGYSTAEDYRALDSVYGYYKYNHNSYGRDSIPNIPVMFFSAHIAIVYKVLEDGKIMILEQNTKRSIRQSRVVISTRDLKTFSESGKDFQIVNLNAHFIRPKPGKIDYKKAVGKMGLYIIKNHLSSPFARKFDSIEFALNYLGDFYINNPFYGFGNCEEANLITKTEAP